MKRRLADAKVMPCWPHWGIGGGTGLHRWGLTVNEGVFPNLMIRWRRPFIFDIAIAPRLIFTWIVGGRGSA